MSFFQRIFKNVQSQAHSVVDQLEDPIKLSEQGIREPEERPARFHAEFGSS